MSELKPKFITLLYGALIEATILSFSSFIELGPCGTGDGFSAFMLFFAVVFHLPGVICAAPMYLILWLFSSSLTGDSFLSIFMLSIIAANVLAVSWLLYTIKKARSRATET